MGKKGLHPPIVVDEQRETDHAIAIGSDELCQVRALNPIVPKLPLRLLHGDCPSTVCFNRVTLGRVLYVVS